MVVSERRGASIALVAFALIVPSSCAQRRAVASSGNHLEPGRLEIELTALNSTNRLLRGEHVYAFAIFRNAGAGPVPWGNYFFEIRPSGGDWSECRSFISTTMDAMPPPNLSLEPLQFRRAYLTPYTECERITAEPGWYELRIADRTSVTVVHSNAQSYEVVEPGGIDAVALTARNSGGRNLDRAAFVAKFAETPYAGEFLIREAPHAAKRTGLIEWAHSEREMLGKIAPLPGPELWNLRAEADACSAFLGRNPEHFFSPYIRRRLTVVLWALGDARGVERLASELERRAPGSTDAQEAQGLLFELRQ